MCDCKDPCKDPNPCQDPCNKLYINDKPPNKNQFINNSLLKYEYWLIILQIQQHCKK